MFIVEPITEKLTHVIRFYAMMSINITAVESILQIATKY